jgi:ribulose-5-phosphate 4-epimerase/fuculose-1-phosphate aldolase
MDFNGKVVEGKYDESMGEYYFYTAVFRRRKDVHSAVHIHPPFANVLFGAGKNIIPITRDGCLFHKGVSTYDGFPLYVGTPKMGEEVAEALGDRRVVMHRGHGAFLVGRSVEDALVTAITLERAAQTQVLASGLGALTPLRVDEMTDREKNPDDHIIDDFFGFFSGKLAKLEKKAKPVVA